MTSVLIIKKLLLLEQAWILSPLIHHTNISDCLSLLFVAFCCVDAKGAVEGPGTGETYVWIASAHVHHESLGVTLSSWRHDHQPPWPLATSVSSSPSLTNQGWSALSQPQLKVEIAQVFIWEMQDQHFSLTCPFFFFTTSLYDDL